MPPTFKRSTSSKESWSSDAGSSRDASLRAFKRNRTSHMMDVDMKDDGDSSSQQATPDTQYSPARTTAEADATHGRKGLGVAKLLFGAGIEKIPIETIRASNAKADRMRDMVAVFVGATGGIGKATVDAYFRRTTNPRAYIVGRNESRANEVIQGLKQINPAGEAIFLAVECSLIKNVDEACEKILQKEHKINCLFMTTGYMTMNGRTETIEGLDRKMVVNYYSRMRWAMNLMPALTNAYDAGELSRVITVLAAGSEGDVNVNDLDLRHGFSLSACLAHCVLMSDFMIEELSKRHARTSFSHSYPGTVKTGIANELTGPIRLAVKVMYAVMSRWILDVEESGERHFFQMTSQCYPAAAGPRGVEVPRGLQTMQGSNGGIGSGSYLLDWDGKPTGDPKYIRKYRAIDFGNTVWEHTMKMFKQAEDRNPSSVRKHQAALGSLRQSSTESGSAEAVDNPVGWRAG